jgi:hypothetical protein
MFITGLSVSVVKFHPTVVDVKVFPMCIVHVIEFTLVCFWLELRQYLVRQKYHSLKNLNEFCCLSCNVLRVSSQYFFALGRP